MKGRPPKARAADDGGLQPTTNTNTFFFREPEAIELVKTRVLAPLARSRRSVALWSAGCSTGDEAYSLAITAAELGCGNVRILATDVRGDALAHAAAACYAPRNLRHVSPERRARWFEAKAGSHTLRAQLREMVTFRRHDVTRDTPCTPLDCGVATADAWDVIFCRNLLVYYNRQCVGRTLTRLASVMTERSLLILSGAEWLSTSLRTELDAGARLKLDAIDGVLVYRKEAPRAPVGGAATSQHHSAARQALSHACPVHLPRRHGEGGEAVSRAGAAPEPPLASAPAQQADALLQGGDLAGAAQVIDAALLRDPLAPEMHLRRGICCLQRHDEAGARESLRRSLFLEPGLWMAAWLLGDLLHDTEPTAARRYFALARDLLQRTGGDDEAVERAQHGLEVSFPGRRVALEAARARLRAFERR